MNDVEEYLAIGGFFYGHLKQQVDFDLNSFQRTTGRELIREEADKFHSRQSLDLLGAGTT